MGCCWWWSPLISLNWQLVKMMNLLQHDEAEQSMGVFNWNFSTSISGMNFLRFFCLEDIPSTVIDGHCFRMGKLMGNCKKTAGPVLKTHRDLKFMCFWWIVVAIHRFWSKFKKVCFLKWKHQRLLDVRNQNQMIYARVVKEVFFQNIYIYIKSDISAI